MFIVQRRVRSSASVLLAAGIVATSAAPDAVFGESVQAETPRQETDTVSQRPVHDADGPDFLTAIARALARAPELEATRSRAAAARQNLARAGALPDPRLLGGIQNLPIGGGDAFAVDADRMTMRRIGLSQQFPARAAREAAREKARAEVSRARAESLAARLQVQRATAGAWIALWTAARERDLLDALAEHSALAVRTARARLEGGRGSATDALAVRSAALALDNRIADAAARVDAARASLTRWMGSVESVPADGAPDFSRTPFTLEAMLARVDDTIELLGWDAREASAQAALAAARAERESDWTLSGGYAQRGAGASDVMWLEASVGLTFLTRDRQNHGIAARSAALDAVRSEREAARRAQSERIRRLHAEWEGLGAQVRRLDAEILPLAMDRTRIALAAYAGGAPLQPWLDARRDEIEARVSYARTLARWGETWAALAFLLPAEEATP